MNRYLSFGLAGANVGMALSLIRHFLLLWITPNHAVIFREPNEVILIGELMLVVTLALLDLNIVYRITKNGQDYLKNSLGVKSEEDITK